MQSVSPSGRFELEGGGSLVWEKVRGSFSGGRLFSAILVVLLTFNIARSTATFHWVDGIEVVTPIALLGSLLLGALALSPVSEPIGLSIGALLAAPVAMFGAWPEIYLRHPSAAFGPQLFQMWWKEGNDGTLSSDTSFFLVLICLLMWITGGWLSWCVLRWRKPMLGLIPGAAAFATNLLNIYPGDTDQNFFTLAMLVLTIALLLWTNYTTSIANAVRAHVKLTGDARWDFWESGLVAMTALIVLSIFLPQLSNSDRTTDVESGMFSSWAHLQQELNHPGFISVGRGAGTTGFNDEVNLGAPLERTRDPVFIYTLIGENGGPRYFRGVNATFTSAGEWRYPGSNGTKVSLQKNEVVVYGEHYDALGLAGFSVKMIAPPIHFSDVLFYPGQLLKVDRSTAAQEVPLGVRSFGDLMSIDRLGSVQPTTSAGSYVVYSEYSDATTAQLEAAGTNYPDWVKQFATVPSFGYRPADVMARIHDLALKITAGLTNPYDQATAIESYLRDHNNFTYTLSPQLAPPGRDKIDFFLFSSHEGYCEYFATAMGDMLRSLGIPTRLVNGYGPGTYDPQSNSYVVRGEDAHTWVEAYFPAYGWIPFEPTADTGNLYQSIIRGPSGSNLCLRDAGCDTSSLGVPPVIGGTAPTPRNREKNDPAGGPTNGGLTVAGVLDPGTLSKIVAVLLAILLLALAGAARYLRPRTVMAVWKRAVTLADLAGLDRRPGETPLELGRRMQRSFPEAAEPVDALANGFVVAAYAPPDMASTSRSSVMEAWTALRPMLLRRLLARFRPTRL